MHSAEAEFVLEEYLELWKHWGVESLEIPVLTGESQGIAEEPVPAGSQVLDSLNAVQKWLGDCRRCGLCEGRRQIVFGVGSDRAQLMFIGEGPGADEDNRGEPFVGRAGQLLTKIIEAMGLRREQVYITNVVKCRPPENRAPTPDEIAHCLPFLKAQIEKVSPRLIVALGATAASALTGSGSAMSNLRGHFHPLLWNSAVPVMPTYHPAYLLRNAGAKRMVWEDMKAVQSKLQETS